MWVSETHDGSSILPGDTGVYTVNFSEEIYMCSSPGAPELTYGWAVWAKSACCVFAQMETVLS